MTNFANTQAVALNDREYFDIVYANIEIAKRRIWASLFIFDIRPSRDVDGKVLDLCAALIQQQHKGVDVRIITNGFVNTQDISVANLATGLYLKNAGVPQRRAFATDEQRTGSHAKFALFDNYAVLGSQNWSNDAFSDNIEDAVLLKGDIVDALEYEFISLWDNARGLPAYVAS